MAIKWISHCSADALIFLRNVLLRLRREQVDAGCEIQSRKTDARFFYPECFAARTEKLA